MDYYLNKYNSFLIRISDLGSTDFGTDSGHSKRAMKPSHGTVSDAICSTVYRNASDHSDTAELRGILSSVFRPVVVLLGPKSSPIQRNNKDNRYWSRP